MVSTVDTSTTFGLVLDNCADPPTKTAIWYLGQAEASPTQVMSIEIFCIYSRSKKNWWRFRYVPSHSDAVAPFMPAVPFPFCMYACIINNWAWFFDVQKKKEGQHVDSPTRIDLCSFILLWSSKLFWGGSLLSLFDFELVLRLRLDWVRSLLLTINQSRVANWLWSPSTAIAWIERCFFCLS